MRTGPVKREALDWIPRVFRFSLDNDERANRNEPPSRIYSHALSVLAAAQQQCHGSIP
jgi:hypothetical protein